MRFFDTRLLWLVEDVYSPADCARLIAEIERGRPELATNNPVHRDQDRLVVAHGAGVLQRRLHGWPGLVAIFQHKLRHEGRPIVTGTRYAMRTDVLYRAPFPIHLSYE